MQYKDNSLLQREADQFVRTMKYDASWEYDEENNQSQTFQRMYLAAHAIVLLPKFHLLCKQLFPRGSQLLNDSQQAC